MSGENVLLSEIRTEIGGLRVSVVAIIPFISESGSTETELSKKVRRAGLDRELQVQNESHRGAGAFPSIFDKSLPSFYTPLHTRRKRTGTLRSASPVGPGRAVPSAQPRGDRGERRRRCGGGCCAYRTLHYASAILRPYANHRVSVSTPIRGGNA